MQAQKRSPVTLGALFHDHLVSILFIFSGVFLVNYVLISSAAVGSGDTLLLTFQDVVELMNQVRVCFPFCSFYLFLKLFSSISAYLYALTFKSKIIIMQYWQCLPFLSYCILAVIFHIIFFGFTSTLKFHLEFL